MKGLILHIPVYHMWHRSHFRSAWIICCAPNSSLVWQQYKGDLLTKLRGDTARSVHTDISILKSKLSLSVNTCAAVWLAHSHHIEMLDLSIFFLHLALGIKRDEAPLTSETPQFPISHERTITVSHFLPETGLHSSWSNEMIQQSKQTGFEPKRTQEPFYGLLMLV